jgi:hypothetical protein
MESSQDDSQHSHCDEDNESVNENENEYGSDGESHHEANNSLISFPSEST